jgi:uncharacterized protein (DUF58 family)
VTARRAAFSLWRFARTRPLGGARPRRALPFAWLLSRLSREGRLFLSLICAAVLFASNARQTESHVLLLATLSLVISALLFTRGFRLDGVTAHVGVPERVAVGDEATIVIELRNSREMAHRRIRIEPPRLPRDGSFSELPGEVAAVPSLGRASTRARVRFRGRGVHQLEPFRAALLLPLGLSQGPAVTTLGARIVVVPRVAKVTSVTTDRGRRYQPGGIARVSRSGDASELCGVRPYRPGDPIRQLHARSWARHGSPMVREYQEEYFTRVGVLVDLDSRKADSAHVEAALSLAAGIVDRLCKSEALIDVLMAGDHVEQLPVGRGTSSFERALDVLAAARAKPGFSGQRWLSELNPFLGRLSSMLLVSVGWDDERATFVASLEARGVRCSAWVVGAVAVGARARNVPITAITSGEEISL